MHDQKPQLRLPKVKSIFAAVLLASALPLACSTASAQDAEPIAKIQVSIMLGSARFETDLGIFGTEEDGSPISLSYGLNLTERHGILVQLTPSTDLKEAGVPGVTAHRASYESSSVLYKAMFPTKKENIKPYALVGLSNVGVEKSFVRSEKRSVFNESGVGIALGAGVDFFVSPDISLRALYLIDSAREAGDIDVSASVLHFGVGFHF